MLHRLLVSGPARVGSLAVPSAPLDASTSCLTVADRFQVQSERTCLLVVDPEHPAVVGLASRPRFLQELSGRFGFGRALLGKAPIGQVATWSPFVIDADATIQQAAAGVLQRGAEARYDDLVVRFSDGTWGTLTVAAVFEALSRKLADQAMFDALTGLANRELLLAELTQSCEHSRGGARMALLFIDLDRFKQVNDVHGHHAGDQLLQAIAGRLRTAARPGDLVARLGGDEFAVMLTLAAEPALDPARVATAVAQRMLAAIGGPVAFHGVNLMVGASIGVGVSGETGSDPDTLLREADLAMYQAKCAGGDRVHTVSSVGMQLAAPLIGLAVDDTLSRALTGGEFVLHYQPIKDLASGDTVSVEALIRWQHPQRGLLPPAAFLPAAEASGLIIEIDRCVLAEACRQLSRWDRDPDLTAPPYINVNLSTAHLTHPGLVGHVMAALTDSGLPPGRLRLELPETATLRDLQTASGALRALREAGVGLILDDIGAGSSTLRHLSALQLDGVKIDRSFVGGLLLNDRDPAIVRLLIDLAHNINIKVTAEGIETDEQRQALLSLGCSYGQGYHLGRPAAAEAAAAELRHGTRKAAAPKSPSHHTRSPE